MGEKRNEREKKRERKETGEKNYKEETLEKKR